MDSLIILISIWFWPSHLHDIIQGCLFSLHVFLFRLSCYSWWILSEKMKMRSMSVPTIHSMEDSLTWFQHNANDPSVFLVKALKIVPFPWRTSRRHLRSRLMPWMWVIIKFHFNTTLTFIYSTNPPWSDWLIFTLNYMDWWWLKIPTPAWSWRISWLVFLQWCNLLQILTLLTFRIWCTLSLMMIQKVVFRNVQISSVFHWMQKLVFLKIPWCQLCQRLFVIFVLHVMSSMAVDLIQLWSNVFWQLCSVTPRATGSWRILHDGTAIQMFPLHHQNIKDHRVLDSSKFEIIYIFKFVRIDIILKIFSDRGTNLKPFLKNCNSLGVMGRYGDRLDGSSSQRLLGWSSDVAAGVTANLRYLTRLHDPLQVSYYFLRRNT